MNIAVYSLTGILSPTLIDYMSRSFEIDKMLLLPVLCNSLGMALVTPLTRCMQLSSADSSSLLAKKTSDDADVIKVTLLDLTANSLVTVGLMNVGSATFTVIYSSSAAWTAILSWCMYGNPLSEFQIAGVSSVTMGLLLNGLGHAVEDGSRSSESTWIFTMSCLVLLLGTVLHSMVTVKMAEFSKDIQQRAYYLATRMGMLQAGILASYVVLRLMWMGQGHEAIPLALLPWLGLLCSFQSLHAVSFFGMLGRIGAVGSAVLKGFLALNTFGLAAAMFCDQSHSEQCMTPMKGLSMVLVMAGGILYAVASKQNQAKKKEQPV